MLPKHETCPAFAQSITAKSISDMLDRSPERVNDFETPAERI